MRVVWKDSNPKTQKPIKYRGHFATGYKGGWIIDIPGDDNVYTSHYTALNAIDKALGGYGQMGTAKRRKYGVKVLCKKE